MKKFLLIPLAVVLVSGLILGGCAAPAPAPAPKAEPIVITGLCVFDPERPQEKEELFVDKVNERAKGELRVDIIGGPEVIGMFDQPEALRDGAIGYLQTFSASHKAMVPEAIVMPLSEHMPWEEREEGGYYDFLVECYSRPNMNAHYLGRIRWGGYYFYTNKPIQKVGDFKGLKVGVTSLWKPLSEALGCTPAIIEEPDIYTAMDRGVIEAYIGPPALPVDFGVYEITKYIVRPAFYTATNRLQMINLDTWNSVPKHLQDLMDEVAAEIEPEVVEFFIELNEGNLKECTEHGMEYIDLPPDQAEEYIRICNSVMWEEVKALVSPETYAKLRELLLK